MSLVVMVAPRRIRSVIGRTLVRADSAKKGALS
jgi:hypothetical protein